MSTLSELHEQIHAITPIDGLSPHSGRIDYQGTPTAQQRSQCEALLTAYNAQTDDEKATSNRNTPLVAAARALNGTAVTSLNAVQVREVMALLLVNAGWVDRNGLVDIPLQREGRTRGNGR